jgi:hypothetical protein
VSEFIDKHIDVLQATISNKLLNIDNHNQSIKDNEEEIHQHQVVIQKHKDDIVEIKRVIEILKKTKE